MSASLGRRLIAFALVLAALALTAAPASALWEPSRLVSKSATEQADVAAEAAISGDGRYLAFQGTIGGLTGIFRKDLQSGQLLPIAVGDAYLLGPATEAQHPSISVDGRYVSFVTPQPLDLADDPQPSSRDVYVADLDSSPPIYELASGLDGSSTGITYEGESGAILATRSALSGDGRKVAFVVEGASNLGGVEGGTPGGQVMVRNLATRRTTLVSVERDPVTGAMEPGVGVKGGAVGEGGAALSGDGSTVAWLGEDLDAQVATVPGTGTEKAEYQEPLWRRVGDGLLAPTRRIVGGPDGPFPDLSKQPCPTGSNATGWLPLGRVESVPQLSADGRTVALIGQPNGFANVFLVDMHDGLTRAQAIRQLTREIPTLEACQATELQSIPTAGPVTDVAISADGRHVAFTTGRQQFPLAPPSLATPAPPGIGLNELYAVDLKGETIERVTAGLGGAPSSSREAAPGLSGASEPSFTADGGKLAFVSVASNLVAGDANGAADAFVAEDVVAAEKQGTTRISPAPPNSPATPKWQLILSARSLPNGNVRLVAVVPAAGGVRAKADAMLATGGRQRKLTAAHGKSRASEPVKVTLVLPRRYQHLARGREGLFATAVVSYRGGAGKPLRGKVAVRFRVHARTHRGGKKGSR